MKTRDGLPVTAINLCYYEKASTLRELNDEVIDTIIHYGTASTSPFSQVLPAEFLQQRQPFASAGVYVNFLGDEGEARLRASYGANYAGLVALKNRYDPTNFFHVNQNIRPTVK
jgi:hypothetical protein